MSIEPSPTPTPVHCPLEPTHVLHTTYDLTPCDPTEIEPLLAHLRADAPVEGETVAFPRGTLTADGRLDLCKQSVGPGGCRLITGALAKNTRVKSLLLGTDGIGDTGAADVAHLIGENDRLEIVYLGCNRIGPEGAQTLAHALEENASVTGLWLKRNPIGNDGAHAVAAMLRRNRTLRTLDLVNAVAGCTAGINAVLDALIEENRTVERLYLGGNDLGPETAERLAELLRRNPHLTALMLNVNRLGDTGIAILAPALQENRTLTELGLASNGIGPGGAAQLFAALTTHPTLRSLDLGYSPSTKVLGASANTLGDPGTASAAAYLAANPPALRRLDLCRTSITDTGRATLTTALEQNTNLTTLLLDGRTDARIAAALTRNRERTGISDTPPTDVSLIQSVYRTTI